MFKRIRKICLCKGCKEKSVHFGIGGRKSNGLCDYHYKELNGIKQQLEEIVDKLNK